MLPSEKNTCRTPDFPVNLALYGNDIDYVDDIASEVVEYAVERVREYGATVKHKKPKFPIGLGTFQS